MSEKYFPTIGIEIHTQLATKTKMFCGCDNDSRTAEPNTNICPVCLAMPGSLPVINKRAVELAIRLGHGLNAKIAKVTKFDRKNYFYPDSPKGYQITQFDKPIVYDGSVEILVGGEFKTIRVNRAHLEEDAGKLIHPPGVDYSLVDFNRAGTPLLEIVSEPDIHSPEEAKRYLQEIYHIAIGLGVTDGDMEHGNFKFDLNISMSDDSKKLGTRTELKNLNSFRNAERALTYEIKRQTEVLNKGQKVDQETRGWNDAKAKTFSQRGKEEAHDYRYFPEPDLPPLVIKSKMITELTRDIKTLPINVRRELSQLGLTVDEQDVLIGQQKTMQIYQAARTILKNPKLEKKVVNWLVGDYQAWLSENAESGSKLSGQNLADLIKLVDSDEISSKIAKDIFGEVIGGSAPADVVSQKGLAQVSDDSELEKIIAGIISENPKAAEDYQAGNQKALGFFVGAVMKATKGQASPGKANALVIKLLKDKS